MPCRERVLLSDHFVRWFDSRRGADGSIVRGRGHAFLQGRFIEGQDFVDNVALRIHEHSGRDFMKGLEELLPELKGAWGLVATDSQGRMLAAVDRVRCIPLFYVEESEGPFVAADAGDLIARMPDVAVDEECALEFLLTGYVTGRQTLYRGIHQLRPGEMLFWDGRKTALKRYYRFVQTEAPGSPQEQLEVELAELLDEVFERATKAYKGKRFAIPLSGGFDSRLIAGMLKRHGQKDVVCFSYGKPGNEESRIAEQVAKTLGWEWHFIPYDDGDWPRWMASEEMKAYWRYSGQGCSLPHLQDFPAVQALTESGVASEAVFVPGHIGIPRRRLGGAAHPEAIELKVKRADVPESIFRDHYKLWYGGCQRGKDRGKLLNRIRSAILDGGDFPGSDGVGLLEAWDFENRQARFVVNSVRAYELFGQSWIMPLWDYELMDFFLRVPASLRFRKRLYLATLGRRVFTGQLEPLSRIPVAWGTTPIALAQDIRNTSSDWRWYRPEANPLRKAVRACIPDFLLSRVRGARWRRQLVQGETSAGHPLLFDQWFSDGRPVAEQTVRDALEREGALFRLPDRLRRAVKPSLRRPLAFADYNSLLAAFYLAEVIFGPVASSNAG